MLFRIVLPIIIIILGGYIFISKSPTLTLIAMFLNGVLLLVAGINEIKKREGMIMGIFAVTVAIFNFYVAINIL